MMPLANWKLSTMASATVPVRLTRNPATQRRTGGEFAQHDQPGEQRRAGNRHPFEVQAADQDRFEGKPLLELVGEMRTVREPREFAVPHQDEKHAHDQRQGPQAPSGREESRHVCPPQVSAARPICRPAGAPATRSGCGGVST